MWLLPAEAEAAPIELHDQVQLGVAMFPEGIQALYEGEVRLPLFDSEHVLFKDAHVSLIGHAEITPAFPRGGPVLHFAPIAVWDLTLRAYGTWYFGAFSAVIPVDDPAFTGSRHDRRALIEKGGRSGGYELRFDARTRLKLKLGPVITVFEGEVRKHAARTFDGPFTYFWEPTEMLTIPSSGVVVDRRHTLLFELIEPADPTDRKLWVGSLAIWQTCAQTGDESVRFGPIGIWRPKAGPRAPTLMGGALVWVESRFVPVLPPYSMVAVSWTR